MGSWFGDHGAPMVATPEVLATAELIRHLYEDLGCTMGGPLHAMLDDGNFEDEQIDSDYYERGDYLKRATFEGAGWVYHDDLSCSPEVARVCRLILASFRRMPESWRAAAIGWYEGAQVRYVESLGGTLPRPVVTEDDLTQFVVGLEDEDDAYEPLPCSVGVPCPPFETVTLRVEPDGRL